MRQLDFELDEPRKGRYHVYHVQHAKASDLKDALTGVSSSSNTGANNRNRNRNQPRRTTPPGNRGNRASTGTLLDGELQVTAYDNTNSLIFVAEPQDYEIISGLLEKLDIRRNQVLVEAVIMEMDVSNAFTSNLAAMNFVPGTGGTGRAGFMGISEPTDLLNPLTPGLILGFAEGKERGSGNSRSSRNWRGWKTHRLKSLMGFFQLLNSFTKTNILSTPQILALDNEEANIEIKEQVPVSVGSTTNNIGGGSTRVEPTYKDVTISLKILPFISPDKKSIQMEVTQNSGKVGTQVSLGTNVTATPITTRSIETKVVVNNKDTLVLGGLMQDEDATVENKVPILGDIPILGWLFKSYNKRPRKSSLLVFLTPHVIGSQLEAREISDQTMKETIGVYQA